MEITTILPNPGVPGLPIIFGYHTFAVAPDKQLEHYIDGVLRATVPPEGFASYVEQYPAAAPVVASITGPTQQAASQADVDAVIKKLADTATANAQAAAPGLAL
jgi:hypothetical protein